MMTTDALTRMLEEVRRKHYIGKPHDVTAWRKEIDGCDEGADCRNCAIVLRNIHMTALVRMVEAFLVTFSDDGKTHDPVAALLYERFNAIAAEVVEDDDGS